MKLHPLLKLYLFFVVFNCNAQESAVWNITIDTANIFSSPRLEDLNEDGIKDLVVGAGVESVPSKNGVLAIDGNSGAILWKVESRTQVYTSALFQDITGDGVKDVFIGGRAAVYFAINGKTGELIWEFFKGSDSDSRKAGLLNFFGTQFIEDLDDDGFQDLLLTNGGDYIAAPNDRSRSTAYLMVVSSKTGQVLYKTAVPDGKESYYAPHVYCKNNKPMILLGTGGETIEGGLYEVPLKSLFKNSMKKVKPLIQDSTKGFILNSVLADLNNDGQLDLVKARMSAAVSAVDGRTGETIWEQNFGNKECYVTPTLGFFNDDEVPDVFTIIATGTFPMYSAFELVVLDGKSGEFIYRENNGFNQFSPAVSLDLNFDQIDEIIYIHNTLDDPSTFKVSNQLRVIDIKNGTNYMLGDKLEGMSMASAPTVEDINNDGLNELFIISSTLPKGPEEQPKSTIRRIDLSKPVSRISWPGYLGKYGNGIIKD